MGTELFAQEFFNCLISSETSNRFALSNYFTEAYSRGYDFCGKIPYELCHKSVTVTSPFSYEVTGLGALCLLHTTQGAGHLCLETANGIIADYDLTKDTLALIDCRKKHKLTCRHNIWGYTLCFVSTTVLEYYMEKILELGNFIYRLDRHAELLTAWEKLLHTDTDDELHGIIRSRILVDFFAQLYLLQSVERTGFFHIPSYITDMKRRFNMEYDMPYSLDKLAEEYNVNKFRLCREFAKYYDVTPMQYLNNIRMDKARELLLHSDKKVVEIGQLVGIENTNSFIRLFKEKNGVTPLTYRRETPVL